MQQIATSKSDVAALPVTIGVGQSSQSQSEQFRELFKEQQPVYGQPVEPRPVDRAANNRQVDDHPTASASRDLPKNEAPGREESNVEQKAQDKPVANDDKGEPAVDKTPKEAADKPTNQESKDVQEHSESAVPVEVESKPVEQEEVVDWVAFVEKVKVLNDSNESTEAPLDLAETLVSSVFDHSDAEGNEEHSSDDVLTDHTLITEELVDVQGEKLVQQEVTEEEVVETPIVTELVTELATNPEQNSEVEQNDDVPVDTLVETVGDQSDVETDVLEAQVVEAAVTEETPVVQTNPVDKPVAETPDSTVSQPEVQVPLNVPQVEVVESLLSAPEPELDKILTNLAAIATQLPKPDKTSEVNVKTIPTEVKVSLPTVLSEEQSNEFISALKAGLEEYKAQLQQGHQPAFDLGKLIAQGLQKATSEPVSGESVRALNNALASHLELNSAPTNVDNQTLTNLLVGDRPGKVDVNTASEMAKQVNQQNQQLDKAINIQRHEGHKQLAERVRWMVNQGNMQADIRLDPPDLGSMQVKVSMNGEAASVNFVVQSPQARDALDQAVPRLKELLEEQGIQLGQSSVQQEQQGKEAHDDEAQLASGQSSAEGDVESDNANSDTPVVNGRLGGIDYFV